MKFLGLISLVILLGTTTWAGTAVNKDVGLDDIMDAYLLAKADVGNIQLEPKNVQKEPYTVQVAAYLSEQDAVQHVKELKKSKELAKKEVFYFTNFARGQIWYKVSVGRFADMVKAERFRKNFVKKMEEPFAVVIDLKGKTPDRKTASLESMNIKKEKTTVPQAKAKGVTGKGMKVAMVKKDQAKNTQAVKTTPAKVTDYLYSLQIGAFSTEKEAQEKAKALATTETAYVTSAVVKGKTWYRVLVGKFETKREAEVFRASYKQQTQDTAAFVKRMAK